MKAFGKTNKNSIERRSFASILARSYINNKGFKYGSTPEVADVAGRCDIVLTKRKESLVHIIFMIDCQTNPNKKFTADPSQLKAIAARFQNSAVSKNINVVFQIMEIGFIEVNEASRDRMQDYQFDSSSGDIRSTAWIIGVDSKTLWTSARFNGFFHDARFINRLLHENDFQTKKINVVDQRARFYFPVLSLALIALMCVIYGYEVYFSGYDFSQGVKTFFNLKIDLETLSNFGAINRIWVLHFFQWYRFVAAPFLHVSVLHLGLESLGLLLTGILLEGLISRAWYFSSLALCIFMANYLSLGIPTFLSPRVGLASGILGLTLICLIQARKVRQTPVRLLVTVILLGVCALLNTPDVGVLIGQKISYFNNFCGAFFGLLLGLLLGLVWPKWEFMPKYKPFAFMLCLATLMGCSHGIVKVRYALGIKGDNLQEQLADAKIPDWMMTALKGPLAVKEIVDRTAGMFNGIEF